MKLDPQQVPPEEDIIPCLSHATFYCYTCGFQLFLFLVFPNLFIGSTLSTLDLYMKYTAEMVPLHTYIGWFISVLV